MGDHIIQGGIGILRLFDANNLNLVELVQTVKSADILSIRSGLTTEARSIGCHLHREIIV